MNNDTDNTRNETDIISFADFLKNTPPSTWKHISDLGEVYPSTSGIDYEFPYAHINKPDLLLHCANPKCNGPRVLRYNKKEDFLINPMNTEYIYLTYICSDCQSYTKTFSIAATLKPREADKVIKYQHGKCYKFGELPEFGPSTPARLISLIGSDRDIFLKGRRSEIQGLGIGAFVYYRRVVENQKNKIIDEILKVAEKVEAPASVKETLNVAKTENQFSKALELAEVPQSLLINGYNPLSLLHTALSDGLHAQTDERCLQMANNIRIVLAELSERIGRALKDEVELKHAISVLIAKKDAKP